MILAQHRVHHLKPGLVAGCVCVLAAAPAVAQQGGSACPLAGTLQTLSADPLSGLLLLGGGAVLGAVLVGVADRLRRRQPSAPPASPEPPAATDVVEDTVPEEEPTPAPLEGPGPLVARLETLCHEFEDARQDVLRYGSHREVQLQQWQRTGTEVVRRLLPVIETLQAYLEDPDPRVAEVAQLAYGRLMTELTTVGVRQLSPQPGEPFDARYHQLDVRTCGVPPYTITEVVTPGYLFAPRVNGVAEIVLTPAEVVATGVDEDEEDGVPVYDLSEEVPPARMEERVADGGSSV